MRWSDEDFRQRVAARALVLGKSLTRVQREAGLAKDYFRKPPAHGRNLAGVLQIAEVLKVNPAELIGLDNVADGGGVMTGADLNRALELSQVPGAPGKVRLRGQIDTVIDIDRVQEVVTLLMTARCEAGNDRL